MCLTISRWHHHHCQPKISKKAINVYKVLIHYYRGIITPVQEHSIHFLNRIAQQEAALIVDGGRVFYGIHAFRSKKQALKFCHYPIHYIIHNAVIPPNTKYYIGTNKDIVSERLIIFDN